MSIQIFLSHAHGDRALAEALRDLLAFVFDSQVVVQFSSDQSSQGGIQAGKPWREWIDQNIETAAMTVVLLTPIARASPWVLWEAGVAHGVALRRDDYSVVPLTFGLQTGGVPDPLTSGQGLQGDDREGILRLLQAVNEKLGGSLGKGAFTATTDAYVPSFLEAVKGAKKQQSGVLLDLPGTVPTATLAGQWVTAYDFMSEGITKHHVDIATIERIDDRRLRATNCSQPAVTEGHVKPFQNNIQAEIVDRHVLGNWRNASDLRYFGGVHLAILPGEDLMEGYYTSIAGNSNQVGQGRWRWVRLEPASLAGVDLGTVKLKAPAELHQTVWALTRQQVPLRLTDVIQGAP